MRLFIAIDVGATIAAEAGRVVTEWWVRWTGTRARRARAHGSVLVRFDWALIVAAVGLSVLGALLVWSATRRSSQEVYLTKHLVNLVIGLGLGAAVSLIDGDERPQGVLGRRMFSSRKKAEQAFARLH